LEPFSFAATRIKAVVSDVDWERILKDADEKKMSIVAEFTATVRDLH